MVAERSSENVPQRFFETVLPIVDSDKKRIEVTSADKLLLNEDLAVSEDEILDFATPIDEDLLLASDSETITTTTEAKITTTPVAADPFSRQKSRSSPHSSNFRIPKLLSAIVKPTQTSIKQIIRSKVTKEQIKHSVGQSKDLFPIGPKKLKTPGFKPNLNRVENQAPSIGKDWNRNPKLAKGSSYTSQYRRTQSSHTSTSFHRNTKTIGTQTDFEPLVVTKHIKCETCTRRNNRRNIRRKNTTNQLREKIAELTTKLNTN